VLPARLTGGDPVAELRLHADDAKGRLAHVRQQPALRAGTGTGRRLRAAARTG
jgi:hypothetical protein